MADETNTKVIIDSVSVSNLIGKDQTINATWHLSDPLLQMDGYILSIMSAGKSLYNFTSEVTTGTFSIPNNLLTSGVIYSLQIWYKKVGGGYGTGSDLIQLVLEAPTISATTGYDLNVTLAYTVPAIYNGYQSCQFTLEAKTPKAVVGVGNASQSPATITTVAPLSSQPGTYVTYGKIVLSGKSSGPSSDSVDVTIFGVPSILSSKYQANKITVTYDYVNPTSSQQYQITVYENGTIVQTVLAAGLLSKSFTIGFTPSDTKQYTLTVQALSGSFSGPASALAAVYIVKPTISLVSNNQQKVITGQVTYPAGSVYGDSVLLSLFVNDNVVQNAPITVGSQASLTYTGNFTTASSYSVAMATVDGVSIGELSDRVEVIWQVDTLSNVTFDGQVVRGIVNLNQNSGSGTCAQVAFNKNGVIVDTINVTPVNGEIAVNFSYTPNTPLTLTDVYSFTVFSTTAVSIGPSSSAAIIFQATPTISLVTFNGSNITVSWSKNPTSVNATSMNIGLYKDGTLVQTVAGSGLKYTFTPSAPLVNTSTYQIKIAYKSAVALGPSSSPQTLITQLPVFNLINYDGTTVNAGLTYPDNLNAGEYGYLLSLYKAGTLVQNSQGSGTNATLIPASPLSTTDAYSVKAAITQEHAIGPYCDAVTIYTLPLNISSVDYRSGTVSVSVSNLPNNVITYTIALYKNGSLQETIEGNTPTTHFTPNPPLTSDNSYLIGCAIHVGISTGPYGGKKSITVLSPPTIDSAIYNGSDLLVNWTLAAGVDTNTFLASIFAGTVIKLNKQGSGLTTNFNNLAGQLTGDQTFVVKVASTNANQIGEYSTPALIIYQLPAITAATYSHNTLSVNWTLPDVTYTGMGYQLDLFKNGVKQETFEGSGTSMSATPTTVFVTGSVYSVNLSSVNGVAIGPRSASVEIVALDAPVLTAVSYSGNDVTLTFTYSGLTTPTNYIITVYKQGIEYFSLTTTEKTTSFVPLQTLYAEENYTIAVAATYNGITGEESAPAVLIAGAPTITSTQYDITTLSVAWTLLNPSVGSGYKVTISDSAGGVEMSYTGNGTNTQFPIESFVGNSPYSVAVQSTNSISLGVMSQQVALVLFKPIDPMLSLVALRFNGSFTTSNDVLSYKANLYDNGEQTEQKIVSSSPLTFETALQAGHIYTFNVVAESGISSGPVSDIAYGPFSANRIFTFDDLSRLVAIDSSNYKKTVFTVDAKGNITSSDIQAPTQA
ncbi:hypothetical protein H0255_19130 [Pectobacterium versatile]|uniref:hypothetical protein n=1 Tax=Pectobacterium versatile TaxID=2488639 RepID=UPI0015E03F88|nr:hypothetical protein [Pectobacterium versatile]MBA0165251.1 hypothetical protein [Pectobacterium versatile]MBN3062303.1 hypothetical protein [Pectobacterium versatile]